MKKLLRTIGVVSALVLATAAGVLGQASNGPNGNAYGYVVHGNTPGFVQSAMDNGATDPTTVITVTAWLKLHNESQLDQLVQQLYSKNSPSFHKWINQDQFNASFSPSPQEANAVQNFLTAHGFSILAVAENNFYVKAQGTVGQVEQAFHVQIHNFSWNGAAYRSNTSDPGGDDSAGKQPRWPLLRIAMLYRRANTDVPHECDTFHGTASYLHRKCLWRADHQHTAWPSALLRLSTERCTNRLQLDTALCARTGRYWRDDRDCGCLRLRHDRAGCGAIFAGVSSAGDRPG